MEEPSTFDLSAAAWRRNIQDERMFVEALAIRFEQALPDKTTVIRNHRLLAKSSKVQRIEIAFDNTEFILEFMKGYGAKTFMAKVVRGIRLKTETVSFADWLSSLSDTVRTYAATHEHLRERLESFLMS